MDLSGSFEAVFVALSCALIFNALVLFRRAFRREGGPGRHLPI